MIDVRYRTNTQGFLKLVTKFQLLGDKKTNAIGKCVLCDLRGRLALDLSSCSNGFTANRRQLSNPIQIITKLSNPEKLPNFHPVIKFLCGPGSSVGVATDYGLDWSGIESQWGRGFSPVHTGLGTHPASLKMGTGSYPALKCGRGVLLTTHPLLVPRSWKSRAIPLPTLWATPGLQRDHFTFLPFT